MSVLIYGATGFTGRLVAAALARRDVSFVLGGRDRHRLQEMAGGLADDIECRVAQVHAPAELSAAMAGCDVVINCAGPFGTLGEPVVRASIEAGAHYLDTTGEQAFMRHMYERYESAARRAGLAVVNGCAFEIALGDWAAAKAAALVDGDCDDLYVAYAMDKFRATPGTQLSAVDSLAGEGVVWNLDRWEPVRPAVERRTVRFPEPFGERVALSFPSGEVVSTPRHIRSRYVQTYISMSGADTFMGRTIGLLGPALPFLLRSPLMTAMKARAGQSGDGPTNEQRRDSAFSIMAEATRGAEHHSVCVTGCDPYGVTAEVIAYAAAHLLSADDIEAGVLAPSQLIAADTGLADIAERCMLEVIES